MMIAFFGIRRYGPDYLNDSEKNDRQNPYSFRTKTHNKPDN